MKEDKDRRPVPGQEPGPIPPKRLARFSSSLLLPCACPQGLDPSQLAALQPLRRGVSARLMVRAVDTFESRAATFAS